ncbi:MAG TPA: phospholipase D-like domain-containing protein [Thermoanaerobaculia bacterium]|nr:phospholipase D-like domain-containing protein [Thermoanaerobaculia bacterium]
MWLAVGMGAIAMAGIAILVLNLATGEKKVTQPLPGHYGVDDPQFVRTMGSLFGPPLANGNSAQGFQNGDEIFPAMLGAIRGARQSICLESYIYWSGTVGREFAEALSERARAGVRVHVLLDWVGSGKVDGSHLQKMSDAGVEVERYRPLRWYNVARTNNRTHRKLLIVDGRIGFTGGVGIADEWRGNASGPEEWRDSHYRLEGPVVAQMQAAFMDNWLETRSTLLDGPEYFVSIPSVGTVTAQVSHSSKGGGGESVRLMYLLSIAAARRSIRLANSYFVPDDLSVDELVAARQRGVRVQIIVPGEHIDTHLVRHASRSRWRPLLAAGVEIFEYLPTMYHCKYMIVDSLWTMVGSTNFDNRSFRLNDEANANIYDRGFAEEQERVFTADLARSRQVTLAQFDARPLRDKVLDNLAGLLRAQL